MFLKQRGATLLEAILAATVLGIVMSYTGVQIKQYAERKAIEERASRIVRNIKTYREYFKTPVFKLSQKVDGLTYFPNPLYKLPIDTSKIIYTEAGRSDWGKFGRYLLKSNLEFFKLQTCAEGGKLNEFVTDIFFTCGEYDIRNFVTLAGIYAYLTPYKRLEYPSLTTRVFAFHVYYAIARKTEFDELLKLAVKIPEITDEFGFHIPAKRIYLTHLIRQYGYYIHDQTIKIPISQILDGDIKAIDQYKKTMNAKSGLMGIAIELDLTEAFSFIEKDGSVPMDTTAQLCWSDNVGDNRPCIGAIINDKKPTENAIVVHSGLKVDGDLVYKDNDGMYRTPVEISYHSFDGINPTKVPYINCPQDLKGQWLVEKFAAVPSSFSTGTNNTSNFTDPKNIYSGGTQGANNKEHTFTSGMSLQWNFNDSERKVIVRGAVAIDKAYASYHNNKSSIKNPKSISFIAMQWCEQNPALYP